PLLLHSAGHEGHGLRYVESPLVSSHAGGDHHLSARGNRRPDPRRLTFLPMANYPVPEFLAELLDARSPSGYETEAQAVFDRHVKPAADRYENDALGNRIATLNPAGDPILMLAGHLDELGLIITYINDRGFLYFDTIGGHDRVVISGRRVRI